MKTKNTWGSTVQARKMQVKGEAAAFRLWQTANLLDWDCTIVECARAAGISKTTAMRIVGNKGWTGRFSHDAVRDARSNAGMKSISKRHKLQHSDIVDVCDMMELGG